MMNEIIENVKKLLGLKPFFVLNLEFDGSTVVIADIELTNFPMDTDIFLSEIYDEFLNDFKPEYKKYQLLFVINDKNEFDYFVVNQE